MVMAPIHQTMLVVCEKAEKDARKGFVMAKKKIHVGWVMMRLNKAGNWVPCRYTRQSHRYLAISNYSRGHVGYRMTYRAGTLKVVKMYVTM